MNGRDELIDVLGTMVDGGLPDAFIYVEDPDGSSTFLTARVADLESGRRMRPDGHYRIGITTKTFTAVVVLQLVRDGCLNLEVLVSRWLPDRELPNGGTLDLEHLLRMRSGLADFVDHPSLVDLDANLQPHTLEEVLDLELEGEPNFEPGELSADCNTNFCQLIPCRRVQGPQWARVGRTTEQASRAVAVRGGPRTRSSRYLRRRHRCELREPQRSRWIAHGTPQCSRHLPSIRDVALESRFVVQHVIAEDDLVVLHGTGRIGVMHGVYRGVDVAGRSDDAAHILRLRDGYAIENWGVRQGGGL